MRVLSLMGLCLMSVPASAAGDLPWAFVSGSADGYSVDLVSASPAPGTTLCSGSRTKFEVTVKYTLQIRSTGKVVLVIQDDANSKVDGAGPSQVAQPIAKGKGTVVISDTAKVPVGASEVRLFLPVVPDGIEETDGELVLRYPVKRCA